MSAGYADALLGVAQTGINVGFNMQAGRKQKEMDRLKRQIQREQRQYSRWGDEQQRQAVNRDAFSAEQNIASDANADGVLHSSRPMALGDKLDAEQSRRIQAINKRADLNEFTWSREDSIVDLNKSLKRLREMQGLVNSLFDSGASGAGSYYGGAQGYGT